MISSARGVALGGSSLIGSQPTGGEPGGDIKKFLSSSGTLRYLISGNDESDRRGLRSAGYSRNPVKLYLFKCTVRSVAHTVGIRINHLSKRSLRSSSQLALARMASSS